MNESIEKNPGKTPYQITILDQIKKHKTKIDSDGTGLNPDKRVLKEIKKLKGIMSVEAIY